MFYKQLPYSDKYAISHNLFVVALLERRERQEWDWKHWLVFALSIAGWGLIFKFTFDLWLFTNIERFLFAVAVVGGGLVVLAYQKFS